MTDLAAARGNAGDISKVDRLLGALTLDEKAALTAGEDMLSTVAIERLGIPKISVTDGPNGTRAFSYPGIGGPAAICTPCGSAMGATWAPELVERLGALVGREALDRGCRGLLAPTVNLHRAPLAGRNFECFSEDPLLTGRLAAAYVRGVQSNGVFATVKHFVGNEAEHERSSLNSVIDERALRELYLVPFEMAVRDGGALGIMTAYNRLNGRWLTEQRELLIDILRDEWGFAGLVMTDWFAVADSALSPGAGLDLEMPGPGRALGAPLAELVRSGSALESDIDAAVRRLLGGLDRIGALDAPPPVSQPRPPGPYEVDLIREGAAEATVLLANDGILPLDPAALTRVALLGDHAGLPRVQGGGSARVIPHQPVSPRDALARALGDGVDLVFERGCEADMSPTPVGGAVLRAPDGFDVEVYEGHELAGEPVLRARNDQLRLVVYSAGTQGYPDGDWSARLRGVVLPEEDGVFELALAQSGRARLLVDGEVLLDGFASPPPPGGADFFGQASQDLVGEIQLVKGVPTELVVEYACIEAAVAGVRVGFRTRDDDALLERAVAAAESSDVAVVFVGTTEEWETEGRDRPAFELPGRQDELVARVATANPRTIVVVNAGAPVGLPWADDVAAALQCWFGGEQMGAAVADILTGVRDPGGRLPTTIPRRLSDSPSYDNFPGENGEVRYGESLFMGYRGYERHGIEPRYAFGHGLSYTAFEIGEPQLSSETFQPGDSIRVSCEVRNVGDRPGTEVVQCYVAPMSARLLRPRKELKAFAKVRLDPGQAGEVTLVLEDRAFAYWDPGQPDWPAIAARVSRSMSRVAAEERRAAGWQVDPGTYEVLIGRSSQDIAARAQVEVKSG